MAEPEEGPLGHVLGSGHGTRVAGAIALGGARVCVDADERVGGEAGGWDGDVEAAGEVGSQLGVRLGVGGQRGQRRLRVSPSAAGPAQRREVERHDGTGTATAGGRELAVITASALLPAPAVQPIGPTVRVRASVVFWSRGVRVLGSLPALFFFPSPLRPTAASSKLLFGAVDGVVNDRTGLVGQALNAQKMKVKTI